MRSSYLKAPLAAAAIGLVVTACGSPDLTTADGLGEAVADAINDQDFDELKELTCGKDRDEIAAESNFDTTRANLNADDLGITVEYVSVEVRENRATLTFTTTMENLPQRLVTLGMSTSAESQKTARMTEGQCLLCN